MRYFNIENYDFVCVSLVLVFHPSEILQILKNKTPKYRVKEYQNLEAQKYLLNKYTYCNISNRSTTFFLLLILWLIYFLIKFGRNDLLLIMNIIYTKFY